MFRRKPRRRRMTRGNAEKFRRRKKKMCAEVKNDMLSHLYDNTEIMELIKNTDEYKLYKQIAISNAAHKSMDLRKGKLRKKRGSHRRQCRGK